MPMHEAGRATPITAAELEPGDVVPIQTATGGVEPRTVLSVVASDGSILVEFTDGTGWAFEATAPILRVNPPEA